MAISKLHNEQYLLHRIAEGSQEAFTVVFDHYKDSLYALAWSLTRAEAVAEDMLQEVFLKIWLHRHELKAVDNFHGYLVVITRRVILNELRKLDRSRLREQHFAGIPPPDPVEDLLNCLQEKEHARLLQAGMEQLSPQQAAVFQLIKGQGYTREQAAQDLGLSPETVKKHLERAMRTMRALVLAHLDHTLLLLLLLHYA